MDGNSTSEGRVELCTQGLWGAISISGWDSNEAVVVCRQLGLPWECKIIK
jgi:deleted-in-malignant-brain-tumors protein 1